MRAWQKSRSTWLGTREERFVRLDVRLRRGDVRSTRSEWRVGAFEKRAVGCLSILPFGPTRALSSLRNDEYLAAFGLVPAGDAGGLNIRESTVG